MNNQATEKVAKERGEDGSILQAVQKQLDSAQEQLAQAREFVLFTLRCPDNISQSRRDDLWYTLPSFWRTDHEVALTAVEFDCCSFEYLPEELRDNRQFLKYCVETTPTVWDKLPESLRNDLTFVNSIDFIDDEQAYYLKDILKRHPSLRHDREFWMGLVNSKKYVSINIPARPYLPKHMIRSDRELMLKACSKDRYMASLLESPFLFERDFIRAVFLANPLALVNLSPEAQEALPDLVRDAISMLLKKSYYFDASREIVGSIAPSFWQDRRFAEHWFRSGGFFAAEIFPPEWASDENIFLLIAKHCKKNYFFHDSFERCSSDLRGNKKFMTKAIALNPKAFQYVSVKLRIDFDLLTLVAASSRKVLRECHRSFYSTTEKLLLVLRNYQQHANESIECHERFVKTILCAIALENKRSCPLCLLDRGQETSYRFIECIAKYADAPNGQTVALIRKAMSNISTIVEKYE